MKVFLLLVYLSVVTSTTIARVSPRQSTNSVVAWSRVAQAFAMSLPYTRSSRNLAILHVAIHDSLSSIQTRYSPYDYGLSPRVPGASLDAAVFAASRLVLSNQYPAMTVAIDAKYFDDIGSLSNSNSVIALGVWVGESVANAVVTSAALDGSTQANSPPYPGDNTTDGMWRPTPPLFEQALDPEWGDVMPWCIVTGGNSRRRRKRRQVLTDGVFFPAPPPGLSPGYADDLEYVAIVGGSYSTNRTIEQTVSALFWDSVSPVSWSALASSVSTDIGFDAVDSARLAAVTSMAIADSVIMAWSAKYAYGRWRPVSAVQATYNISWWPLLITQPTPDYISVDAAFAGSASAVMSRFFGNVSELAYTLYADNGAFMSYSDLTMAAKEAAISRVYGGVHFKLSTDVGLFYGQAAGNWIYDNCLPQPPLPDTEMSTTTTTTDYNDTGTFEPDWPEPQENFPLSERAVTIMGSIVFTFFTTWITIWAVTRCRVQCRDKGYCCCRCCKKRPCPPGACCSRCRRGGHHNATFVELDESHSEIDIRREGVDVL